jgi:CheY-like chemotaxis protein
MPTSGPIIIVEDDLDDQDLLREAFEDLGIPNVLRFFDNCIKTLDYLLTTIERPFLIISDINLPAMTGLELKEKINNTDTLRRKGIPFIFLSTALDNALIAKAYNVLVQGYFVKPLKIDDLKTMLKMIVDYWKVCKQPVAV